MPQKTAVTFTQDDAPYTLGGMWDLHDVVRAVRISKPTIYNWIRDPDIRFPAPMKFGRCSRWSELEVVAWIQARAEERR
jgi:predicted DNA-binding transcriptional regulator AlpA